MAVSPRDQPVLLHGSGTPEQTDALVARVLGSPAVDQACRRAGAGLVEVWAAVDVPAVNALARSAASSCAVRAAARFSVAQRDRFESEAG